MKSRERPILSPDTLFEAYFEEGRIGKAFNQFRIRMYIHHIGHIQPIMAQSGCHARHELERDEVIRNSMKGISHHDIDAAALNAIDEQPMKMQL